MCNTKMKIGVLALQGAFIEHSKMLKKLGVDVCEVRLPEHLEGTSGLIIPGGESTTIMKLLKQFNLLEPIKEKAFKGFPVFGTCAGAICMAKNVVNSHPIKMETLGLMDITIQRNAFGRQVDSFEAGLKIKTLGEPPFPAVFIRAPIIKNVGENIELVFSLEDGTIVAARQGNLLAVSFHPELSKDTRLHKYFIEIIEGYSA